MILSILFLKLYLIAAPVSQASHSSNPRFAEMKRGSANAEMVAEKLQSVVPKNLSEREVT